MKKLALILLALAVALPLVAEDVDIADAKVSISGDATAKWGIDLDTNATGFTNELNAKMRLNFGLAGDMTGSGMDDGAIYGEVKLDEIEIRSKEANNENDTAATWEMDIDLEYAKIMGPGWWVSVKGADDNIDYENATQNGIIGVAAAWDGQMDNVSNDSGSSGGFEVGVDLADAATIELSLYSLTDWTSTLGTADDNAYGAKAEVILTAVENLTVKGAFNMGFGTAAGTALNDDMGLGGLLSYKVAVNDDVSITPEVGLDIHMLDGGGMDMAIGNGLIVTLAGSEITAAEDAIKDDAGNSVAWDDGVDSGIKVGWSYYMPNVGDAALGLQAHIGLSMVENLQLAVGFEAADLLNNGDMGFAVYGDYTMGSIKPFGGVFMLLDNEDNGGSDGETILEAGLTYTDLFPHVDLLVQYNSGNLAADDTGDEADPGILTFGVKVKF
jgi:hypothetical protein